MDPVAGRPRSARRDNKPSALGNATDDPGQVSTTSRSPPSTCAVLDCHPAPTRRRWVRWTGLPSSWPRWWRSVWPASTESPSGTLTVTTPAKRRRDVIGVGAVCLLGCWHGVGDALVAHHHRAQLPVQDAHHGAHAALVGFGDRLEPDDQVDDRVVDLDAVSRRRGAGRTRTGLPTTATCRRRSRGGARIPLWDRGIAACSRVRPAVLVPGRRSSASSSAPSCRCGLGGSATRRAPSYAAARAIRPADHPVRPRRKPMHRVGDVESVPGQRRTRRPRSRPRRRPAQVTDHLATTA